MNANQSQKVLRELYLSSYVKWFLEKCGKTEKAKLLLEDICKAMDGRDKKDGCIRLSSATTFLLFIVDPAFSGGPERVVVWQGPSDGGAFYKDTILEHATPWGMGFN